jgi:putative aldouronate transport system permease protein
VDACKLIQYGVIFMKNKTNEIQYHMMLLPALLFLAVFSIYPLLGSVIAFKDFSPVKGIWGSSWVGLRHFRIIFMIPDFHQVFFNTVYIAVLKIISNLIVPLIFALMLNEIKLPWFKRSVQTIVYLPYFLSWVILAGIFKDMLSSTGVVNKLLSAHFGIEPIMFFASNKWFPFILVSTDVWKNFGFNAIVFLAALTNINPSLYEAAAVDGAGRWKRLLSITLPGIVPTTILLATLGLQHVLNAGFEQVFNLYNPMVYQSGDILDTYIFRMGIQDNQFEFGTAVGLFKSAIGLMFIFIAHKLAEKYANYRIF